MAGPKELQDRMKMIKNNELRTKLNGEARDKMNALFATMNKLDYAAYKLLLGLAFVDDDVKQMVRELSNLNVDSKEWSDKYFHIHWWVKGVIDARRGEINKATRENNTRELATFTTTILDDACVSLMISTHVNVLKIYIAT